MEQRNVSYGELIALQQMFEEQIKILGVTFLEEEYRDECEFDFVDQYINGCDEPEVRLLYPYAYEQKTAAA